MLKRLYGTNEWRPIDAKEEWGISWSGGRRIASQAVADGYAEIVRRGVYRFTDLEIEDHHNPSRPRHIVPIVEEKAVASEPHPEDRVRFNDGRLREEPILSNRAIDTMIEDGVWPEEGPEDLFEIVKLKFRAGHRRRRARERKEWRPWTDFKKLIPEKIAEEVEKHRDMSYAFEIPFDANAAVEQAQRLLKASHG